MNVCGVWLLRAGSEAHARHAAHAAHAAHATHAAHAAHAAHARHAAHTTHTTHHSLCELRFGLLEELFALGVVGVLLNTFLIKLNSLLQVALSLEGHGFALISLRPIGLHLDALICVRQRLIVALQLIVGCRAVAQDRVLIWCLVQGLCIEIDCFSEIFCLESVVSLVFE